MTTITLIHVWMRGDEICVDTTAYDYMTEIDMFALEFRECERESYPNRTISLRFLVDGLNRDETHRHGLYEFYKEISLLARTRKV